MNEESIRNLQKIIQTEQYETDTLSIDIIDIGKVGNVSQHIKDHQCVESIVEFFKKAGSI